MSSEITFQSQLILSNGDLKDQFSSSSISADQTTQGAFRNTLDVPVGPIPSLLDIGGITTPGLAIFQNLDDTNFIQVGTVDGSANFIPFLKLLPGEPHGPMRVATAQLYAMSDTGVAKLLYILYET